MTVEERIKSGELYPCSIEGDDEEMAARRMEAKELIYDYNLTRPSEIEKRTEILKKVFAEFGEGGYIEPPLYCNWGTHVHIGKHFYANFGMVLVDDTDVFIGDNVMIAPNVIIATGGHPISPKLRLAPYQFNKPIHIGSNVWIGAGSILLPGVTIGDNTVIGAGSVVTKDIPANVVAFGDPCRVSREIEEE